MASPSEPAPKKIPQLEARPTPTVLLPKSFAVPAFIATCALGAVFSYAFQFYYERYNLQSIFTFAWNYVLSTSLGFFLFDGWQDFSTINWIFVDFRFVFSATVFYLFAIKAGIKFMENREPYNIRFFLRIYNLSLAILSAYMSYTIFSEFKRLDYTLFCNKASDDHVELASVVWLFYMSKTVEFLDTAWMILRKNFHQITFLHVYHHASIFPYWYVISRGFPSGDAYWTAGLNCAVHTFMYSYYLLTSFGFRPPFKWSITALQLTQFALMLVQCFVGIKTDCAKPRIFEYSLVLYLGSMFALFGNFAYHEYYLKPKQAAAAKRAAAKAKRVD